MAHQGITADVARIVRLARAGHHSSPTLDSAGNSALLRVWGYTQVFATLPGSIAPSLLRRSRAAHLACVRVLSAQPRLDPAQRLALVTASATAAVLTEQLRRF